jgi:hypothetical protein
VIFGSDGDGITEKDGDGEDYYYSNSHLLHF